jgi:hypothetical protein
VLGREHVEHVARTRNVPRRKSASFRVYCISVSRLIASRCVSASPSFTCRIMLWYSEGSPMP